VRCFKGSFSIARLITTLCQHRIFTDKVSKYKYIRGGISFVDEIPKTLSGKILRRELRLMQKQQEKDSLRSKY